MRRRGAEVRRELPDETGAVRPAPNGVGASGVRWARRGRTPWGKRGGTIAREPNGFGASGVGSAPRGECIAEIGMTKRARPENTNSPGVPQKIPARAIAVSECKVPSANLGVSAPHCRCSAVRPPFYPVRSRRPEIISASTSMIPTPPGECPLFNHLHAPTRLSCGWSPAPGPILRPPRDHPVTLRALGWS